MSGRLRPVMPEPVDSSLCGGFGLQCKQVPGVYEAYEGLNQVAA